MGNAKINIAIISLDRKFTKSVAESLSQKLDMFVADCFDMVAYDLTDPKEVIDICGIDYFKKRQKGVIQNCAEYHDTVISVDYELFKEYSSVFEFSYIFYLKLPRNKLKETVNIIEYENRDKFLTENTNYLIELDGNVISKAVDAVIMKLGEEQ